MIRAWSSFASSGVAVISTSSSPEVTTDTMLNIVFQPPVKDVYVESKVSNLHYICSSILEKLESKRFFVREVYKSVYKIEHEEDLSTTIIFSQTKVSEVFGL